MFCRYELRTYVSRHKRVIMSSLIQGEVCSGDKRHDPGAHVLHTYPTYVRTYVLHVLSSYVWRQDILLVLCYTMSSTDHCSESIKTCKKTQIGRLFNTKRTLCSDLYTTHNCVPVATGKKEGMHARMFLAPQMLPQIYLIARILLVNPIPLPFQQNCDINK